MKGTIFAVALNHRSQLDAWREAFQQAPYKTPPKTAVWFIKPRNTVIGDGEAIPYPQGETVQSGATVALIVGKTARKVAAEEAANYIAGYALANDVSLPEESFYRPAIKAKCRDGFCRRQTVLGVLRARHIAEQGAGRGAHLHGGLPQRAHEYGDGGYGLLLNALRSGK